METVKWLPVTEKVSGVTGSLDISMLGDTEETDLIPALYSYNDRNQLTEARTASATATNTFNAEGLRVSKTVEDAEGQVTTEY